MYYIRVDIAEELTVNESIKNDDYSKHYNNLDEFVKENEQWMFKKAFFLLKNEHDAEDVVMESFEKTLRNIQNILDYPKPIIVSYLGKVVKTVTLDEIRKKNRKKEVSYEEIEYFLSNNAFTDSSGIYLTNPFNEELQELMDSNLTDEEMEYIKLKFIDDMNVNDISALQKISISSVYKKLQKIKTHIGNIINEDENIKRKYVLPNSKDNKMEEGEIDER